MNRSRVLAWLLCALVTAVAVAADLREARSLRDHGDYEGAVRAYREVLEAEPSNQEALRELAQVTSWTGAYGPAIELYGRALANDPDDLAAVLGLARTHSWASQFERSLALYDRYLEARPEDGAVRLERAKVRSWSGDYGEAIKMYREHLAAHPGDQGVRLDLARVLSWDGRLDASIEEYRTILEAEPDNLEAEVGLARTLSWSGELNDADRRYDAILSHHPREVGALLGKAQLAIWRGERRQGYRMLEELDAAAPGDPEVARYREELRRSMRRPIVESSADRVQDSDGNDYKVFRVSATANLTRFTTLSGIVQRTETEFGGLDAEVDFVGGRLGLSLPRRVDLHLTAGVDLVSPSHGDDTDGFVWTAAAFGPLEGTWRWNASLAHRTFDALRETTDNGITFNALTGGIDGRIKKWRIGFSSGLTDFSDDNDRLHLNAHALYPWDVGGDVHLEAGYRFRWMEYDVNLNSGYFDPQSYNAHLAVFQARGPLGGPRADWAVRTEVGLQSFDIDPNTVPDGMGGTVFLPGGDQSSDRIFGWQVRLGVDLNRRLRLEGYYGETDYAVQSGSGFDSEQSGLLLRYRF